jgi:uncharacterized protein
MLSKELLEILVCPACKGDLEYDQAGNKLICHACRLRYAIEDDIPIMLVEEAEPFGGPAPAGPAA